MPAVTVQGTINAAWQDSTFAYVSVRVENDDSAGAKEYIGRTPLLDGQGNAKPTAQLQSECVAAASAQRTAEKSAPTQPLPISGTVSL